MFKHVSQTCTDDKTFNSLDRILKIWEERGVYDAATIKEFSKNLHGDRKAATKDAPAEEKKSRREPTKKRKTEEASSSNGDSKKSKTTPSKRKSEVIEVNGTVETHVRLSPSAPGSCDAPEPEELIKVLNELENAASGDAVVREKIANLPPEVSELSMLSKLEDRESAIKLAIKVNDGENGVDILKYLLNYFLSIIFSIDPFKWLQYKISRRNGGKKEINCNAQRLSKRTTRFAGSSGAEARGN